MHNLQYNYGEKLLREMKAAAEKIDLYRDRAYEISVRAVDAILSERIKDETQVRKIFNYIMEWGDDPRFPDLTRRLCRYIDYHYPQIVGDYVNLFRLLFEEDTSGESGARRP